MKIWLISDSHFGHDKMMEYCGRPKGFEQKILNNLFKTVKKDDILIHLGDFCIGNDEFWHTSFMQVPTLKKWLLRGNHDRKSTTWYLSHGWDWVGDHMSNFFFGKKILFSHTPTKYDGCFDMNIHGHFHNNLHRLLEGRYVVEGEKERNEVDLANLTPRHKLLAIEETNYQPVLLENFITL